MRKCIIFDPLWRQWRRSRVDDLLVALCSLALCPSSGFITTESVTADWHPDFNPYTSQFWRDRPLCQDGLRPPLCDAGGLQSCDLWTGKTHPKVLLCYFCFIHPGEHFQFPLDCTIFVGHCYWSAHFVKGKVWHFAKYTYLLPFFLMYLILLEPSPSFSNSWRG